MRVDQAKAIHIRDLLATLGHEPQRQVKGEWWYSSPFRQETAASFKISADGRAWYDHGAGSGGNILKFVCMYYGLHTNDISGALGKLDELHITRATNIGNPSNPSTQSSLWEDAHQREIDAIQARRIAKDTPDRVDHQIDGDTTLSITRIQPLQSWALLQYLKERGIDEETARPWIQEMHYKRGDKPYFSLAFASDSGGYELRSRGFKSAQGKKDITILNVGTRAEESIAVFEGFFDFLSWMQHTGQKRPEMPVLVMNSVATRKRAVEAIIDLGTIKTVHLYADRDSSGEELVAYLQEHLERINVIDESSRYAPCHDYNDFLVQHRKATRAA